MTVTSGLHAQAERTKKQTERKELHPVEAQTKGPVSGDVALSTGAAGARFPS